MPNKDKKYNATCAICGKPYQMCYSCKGKQNAIWKRHCDTAEHYKIYQLIHGYTTGLYTDAEAAAKLKNIDVSDIDELRPHIRDIIKKIQGNVKPKRTVKKEANVDKKDVYTNMKTFNTKVDSEKHDAKPEAADKSVESEALSDVEAPAKAEVAIDAADK